MEGDNLKIHNRSALLRKMGENRNTIFLIMCLFVHLTYFAIFLVMGAIPLCLINAVSSVFYILFLLFSKNRETSERATLAAYFEIILFSTVCELFTRNTFGFIYFVIGMVPVLFYLCPSYGNKRFLFQVIGVISALMIHQTPMLIPDSFFSGLFAELSPYARIFNFVNLLITLFTVLYTSVFYELELAMIRSELDYSSTHDPLTGLYNRRFLYDMINNVRDEQISVILFDIDNFKKINDRFGHDAGDAVLVSLAECIRDFSKDDACPVRWGGEEFILFYKGVDADLAYERISRLHALITKKLVLPDGSHVTVTAGLASGKQSEFDSVVKKADEYLYLGKENGKNCIVWKQNEAAYQADAPV